MQIVERPHIPRGHGSTAFDAEGVATRDSDLIKDGVLARYILGSYSARKLGLQSTGHASRGLAGPSGVSTHNLHMEPGERDLAGLMAEGEAADQAAQLVCHDIAFGLVRQPHLLERGVGMQSVGQFHDIP